jgi:hypothetical protein
VGLRSLLGGQIESHEGQEMRKRSSYKPREVFTDPVSWVINGFKPISFTGEAVSLKIKNHQALFDLTHGDGGRQQIDVLIAAMNIAEALCRVNPDLGLQYSTEIKLAQDAIYTMSKRGLAKDAFRFTGPELKDINLGMEVHDAQLDACSIAELEAAIKIVFDAIRHKRARAIVKETV